MGDLHLSLGCDKPMDIFAGWTNHVERLKDNWNSKITENDTVILLGDHSWAMKLEDSLKDLEFIHKELNGKKILVKGNHDLWWSTMNKITNFVNENGFTSITFLFNNAYLAEGISICGTRGWIRENKKDEVDVKVLAREAGRLEASLKEGVRLGGELTAFIHYPPIYGTEENVYLTEVLHKYGVKRCFYAHLHGSSIRGALNGERDGVTYRLVSADGVNFDPVRVN
ncbi:MAG TPA: serine/threonine protein phosphatase [Ruminococcaceae bacterium]|nr:serine/threonine protein phosphatase [Oscillospiraceae bacterium]